MRRLGSNTSSPRGGEVCPPCPLSSQSGRTRCPPKRGNGPFTQQSNRRAQRAARQAWVLPQHVYGSQLAGAERLDAKRAASEVIRPQGRRSQWLNGQQSRRPASHRSGVENARHVRGALRSRPSYGGGYFTQTAELLYSGSSSTWIVRAMSLPKPGRIVTVCECSFIAPDVDASLPVPLLVSALFSSSTLCAFPRT